MKTLLSVSFGLNLVLALTLAWVWAFGQQPHPNTRIVPSTDLRTPLPAAVASVSKTLAEPPVTVASFHWSQLDSRDYHMYVKNLRAIGCPEPTVRAIVTADVDSVYQLYTRDLEQKLARAENGSWTNQFSVSGSEAALKDQLQKIPDQEAAKIADLLGLKPARTPDEMAAASPPVNLPPPLVLQNVDASALNLSADQKQIIANVRQNFLQQAGGASPASRDPAEIARWQAARSDADNMLMALLGNDIYTKYELLGYQTTLASQATARQ